ncbi:MAG: two-component sensor histidine kinase, partial [Rhodobacteraceae bacterium]|nr:two-component sensor histidine kinase [Paracoccaceae bacterium]
MMNLFSGLQGRLAAAIGVGVVVMWLGAALLTNALLRKEMEEVFDSALQETAQRVLPLAAIDILERDEEGINQRIAQ